MDLARLAGYAPVGYLCEIVNVDGTMARFPELKVMADKFGLKMMTIEALQAYRREHDIEGSSTAGCSSGCECSGGTIASCAESPLPVKITPSPLLTSGLILGVGVILGILAALGAPGAAPGPLWASPGPPPPGAPWASSWAALGGSWPVALGSS